jgi:hypothetical protein
LKPKLTRQRFLEVVGAGATWIALSSIPGCKSKKARSGPPLSAQSESRLTFRSRPDLSPPTLRVTKRAHDTAPGYIFVAVTWAAGGKGRPPMIVDDRGQVVWVRPFQNEDKLAMDFKVQTYQGRPVLTWQEHVVGGEEQGYVILDDSYHEIARLRAGHGFRGDHHEFLITPQDTALITIYASTPADLTSVGGPKDGRVTEGIVQELDIESGEVLFEWHSLDHVGIDETYSKWYQEHPILDYFHLNSIEVDHDNNLLISARQTFTVYKIDRKSGEVIWRLGGKKSDFEMGRGARTAYQHDARRQPEGTISIFDNGTTVFEDGGRPKAVEESRGIVLELDEEEMIATLVREYTHPNKQFAHAGGNMQVLPNGNVFIGWDPAAEDCSEFSEDGELLFSASFSPRAKSYRAFRLPWSGHPSDQPVAVAERPSEDEVKVYASWNGATEVVTWQLFAGPDPERLKPVGSAGPREGFETAITVLAAEPYVAVQAKHRSGEVLGTTEPVKL